MDQLGSLLTDGSREAMAAMSKDAVMNDASAAAKLDEFFRQADRYLRATGEHVEKTADETAAEHLLDAA